MSRVYLFIVFALVQLTSGDRTTDRSEWESYKIQFGRNYSSAEDEYRFGIFSEHVVAIREHNLKFANGIVSFKKGFNQFTDRTDAERSSTQNVHLKSQRNNWNIHNRVKVRQRIEQPVPREFNWMERGAVTPIKDQYFCGSCYAFGAVAALESYYFLKTGQLLNLSEQNFIDCAPYNNGCVGGNPYSCFNYAIENGVMMESDYEYDEMVNPKCSYDLEKALYPISDFEYLESYNEDAIVREIATNGPVVVSIDARHFHDYAEGILDATENCGDTNHVVALVGYGTDQFGKDFYIVKNSWGRQWGEKGFLRIARGINYCSLAEFALTANYMDDF